MEPTSPRIAGVVAVIPEDGCLLVIRRSQHVVAPRKICFPGGGIRPGETEEVALQREIREELGIPTIPVRRLWTSVTPWQVPLAWWLVRRTGKGVLRPDPREVESVHWMRPASIAKLPDLLESNSQFFTAWRRAEQFIRNSRPQFIILQAGADSIAGDPITHMRLSSSAHSHAARQLAHIAEEHCAGRLLVTGGGGYNRKNLASAWSAVVRSLLPTT